MDLKFVAATKPGPLSPVVKRRQRLVQRIDQQIGYCQGIKEGQLPRAAWAWMNESGSYFLPIRYGRQQIELKKGMFSIECPDFDHVEHALCTIRAMVLSGDFDDQLARASAEIRENFAGVDA